MEKWQREGFESFGAWRRADQKRRDDAKRAARALPEVRPSPPQPVTMAMPIAADAQEVYVRTGCPWGSTCTLHGRAHSHRRRVRLAKVPLALVVQQLAAPVPPTTVMLTDPDVASPPRRQIAATGQVHDMVELTPGGSRVHRLERMTPRGSCVSSQQITPLRKAIGCASSRSASMRGRY